MKSNYRRLGDFVELSNNRNSDLKYGEKDVRGVSNDKRIIETKANNKGRAFDKFYIVQPDELIYNSRTSRMGDKVGLGFNESETTFITSFNNTVFRVKNHFLLPKYLFMWFSRPEFDRYARYHSWGSSTELFAWEDMCDMELPIPSIEKQREIVKEYNTIVDRIKLNEQLNQKLEETAQALYKHWFVDFEFPNEEGKPYKSSGGAMVYNAELDKDIPEGWIMGKLSNLAEYSSNRIKVSELSLGNYISTENMIQDRGGVTMASSIPSAVSVGRFVKNDLLISNIRPYFKKIWSATFEGGCSNDILCLSTINENTSLFLYYSLETDLFFDYVMKGAKGTKMPRGDKDWIMNYSLPVSTNGLIMKFEELVSSFSKHVELTRNGEIHLTTLVETLLSKMTKVEEKEVTA